MPKVKIHLDLTLPVERLSVNALIALFQQILTQLVPQLVAARLTVWQESELDRWLGSRWASAAPPAVPWVCPGCQSRLGFSRRGSRPRVLRKTSLGRIPFRLRQVTCQQVVLVGRTTNGGRPRLQKRVVAFGVAEDWATSLTPLASVTPERVVYDGDTELAAVLETLWPQGRRQRCLWHLPRNLYYALWKDGLHKAECAPFQERLLDLLYASPHRAQAQAAYQALLDELQLAGLAHGATYLRLAQAHVFTFWEYPEGIFADRPWHKGCQALLATSPLEREMREINRRTDNGSRWSVPGVCNLVGLDLVRRYDPEPYQRQQRPRRP